MEGRAGVCLFIPNPNACNVSSTNLCQLCAFHFSRSLSFFIDYEKYVWSRVAIDNDFHEHAEVFYNISSIYGLSKQLYEH